MLYQSVKTRQDRPAASNASPAAHRRAPQSPQGARPWQERAIAAQQYGEREATAALQTQLADRIAFLTGHALATDSVYVNATERFAMATVDGAAFRLRHRNLTLLRPCAYCGTGQFASEPIESLADLGHAMAVWEPLHPDCEPTDSNEDA